MSIGVALVTERFASAALRVEGGLKKVLLLITMLAAVVASIGIPIMTPIGASTEDISMLNETLPSFAGAVEWLNSKPLTATDLRGKVVVVEFWTYTCVNWLRTLPYVRAWAEKYKDKGLVVIGVHTPEFGFEANLDNIRQAMKQMRIEYPVAVDSNYAIWNAFGNEYWPALYSHRFARPYSA